MRFEAGPKKELPIRGGEGVQGDTGIGDEGCPMPPIACISEHRMWSLLGGRGPADKSSPRPCGCFSSPFLLYLGWGERVPSSV